MALGWAWVLGRPPLVQRHEEVKPQTGDCALWNITGQVCGGLSEGQGCGMYRGVLWSPWVPREAGRYPAHLDGSDPRMAQALQAQG